MSVKNCVHLVTTEMMSGEGCDYRNDVRINDEKLDILEHPLDGSGENQLN